MYIKLEYVRKSTFMISYIVYKITDTLEIK